MRAKKGKISKGGREDFTILIFLPVICKSGTVWPTPASIFATGSMLLRVTIFSTMLIVPPWTTPQNSFGPLTTLFAWGKAALVLHPRDVRIVATVLRTSVAPSWYE